MSLTDQLKGQLELGIGAIVSQNSGDYPIFYQSQSLIDDFGDQIGKAHQEFLKGLDIGISLIDYIGPSCETKRVSLHGKKYIVSIVRSWDFVYTEFAIDNGAKNLGFHSLAAIQHSKILADGDYGHGYRVAASLELLMPEIGLPATREDCLAAIYHDEGKIAVPGFQWHKTGERTQVDLEITHIHPLEGFSLVKQLDLPAEIKEAIGSLMKTHHEYWNGSGYPFGLNGEAIPVLSRATRPLDIIDALITNRPYRKKFSYEEAKDKITNGDSRTSIDEFEPRMHGAAIKLFDKIYNMHSQFDVSTMPSFVQELVNLYNNQTKGIIIARQTIFDAKAS